MICYFLGINRGSPNDVTSNLALYNHIVINKLVKNSSFLHSKNQRKLSIVTLSPTERGEIKNFPYPSVFELADHPKE